MQNPTPMIQPQPPETVYVSFSSEVVPATTEQLLKVCCDVVTRGVKNIYLLLSTLGGSVTHGITIYNVLRALPAKIITHNVGSVNSIGNVIFLAGEERYANPFTTFMFHGVGFDVQQNVRFEERLLTERLEGLKAEQSKIAAIIKSRSCFPSDEDIEKLFLVAATKDTDFAKNHRIIHDVREVKIPDGAPVVQLVFQR